MIKDTFSNNESLEISRVVRENIFCLSFPWYFVKIWRMVIENEINAQNKNPMSGCKDMDFNEGLNFLNGFMVWKKQDMWIW